MALTTTRTDDKFNLFGTVPVVLDTLQFDNNYPAGGYSVTGQLFGLASSGSGPTNNGIRAMSFVGTNTAAVLFAPKYNSQTGKVQLITAAGAEVAGGTDVSALAVDVIVYAAGE